MAQLTPIPRLVALQHQDFRLFWMGQLTTGFNHRLTAAFGAPVAIITGGLATILLTGWIAWRQPQLRRYTSATAVAMEQTPAYPPKLC